MSTPVTVDLEKRSHFYSTFDAHRLLLWALQQGRQIELKKALLRGYFTDGQNVSEHQTLARLAAEAGLDIESARAGSQSVSAYEQMLREISAVAA